MNVKNETFSLRIDETYVNLLLVLKEITAIPLTKRYDNLMVIRGVSKFYAARDCALAMASQAVKHFSSRFINTRIHGA